MMIVAVGNPDSGLPHVAWAARHSVTSRRFFVSLLEPLDGLEFLDILDTHFHQLNNLTE